MEETNSDANYFYIYPEDADDDIYITAESYFYNVVPMDCF